MIQANRRYGLGMGKAHGGGGRLGEGAEARGGERLGSFSLEDFDRIVSLKPHS